jgi:hypothetical protein
MPMATTSQVLYDGARNLVMQFTGISDGSNETAAVKVDVSELPPFAKSVKVTHMTYDVSGGMVQLLWAANEPIPFLFSPASNHRLRVSAGCPTEAATRQWRHPLFHARI